MNDFTKEELENIEQALYVAINEGSQFYASERISLRLKIQSMIDNYCEHEWENICCQCALDKIYCHKCEKDMGELKKRYNE